MHPSAFILGIDPRMKAEGSQYGSRMSSAIPEARLNPRHFFFHPTPGITPKKCPAVKPGKERGYYYP